MLFKLGFDDKQNNSKIECQTNCTKEFFVARNLDLFEHRLFYYKVYSGK
jgi:hypothetical protein